MDRALIPGLLAVLFWSTVATAFKLSLKGLTPFQLLEISVLSSLLVLGLLLLIRGKLQDLRAVTRKDWLHFIPLALLNPVLYYQILFVAYDRLPAQTAQVLNFTWPLMIVLFSWIAGLERFSLKKAAALLLSFAGTAVVVGLFSRSALPDIDSTGALLAFSSSFVWAAFWLFSKKNRHDPVLSLFCIFVPAALMLAVESIFRSDAALWTLSFESMMPAVYVGIFEMSLTFSLWLTALTHTRNTALLSNLIYLSPFLSLLVIHRVLGETIRIETLLGLLLIVVGIILQWHMSRDAEG